MIANLALREDCYMMFNDKSEDNLGTSRINK